jgi:hypothetical protein
MDNVSLLKFKYLMAEYKSSHDPKFAVDICEMFVNGTLQAKGTTKDGKILFIVSSKYRSKCSKCGDHYEYGDSIFVRDQKAWHLKCASNDDLEHTYFKDCLEKGLVDDFERNIKQ